MLAFIAGLLVAADVGARSVAESQIRDRVVIAAGPAGETAARITSFPFLLRLFTAGDVSRIRVSAADVTVEGLTLARVALDLHGVTLDRDLLLSEQKVVLTALAYAWLQAERRRRGARLPTLPIARAVIGTAAIENPELVREAVDRWGAPDQRGPLGRAEARPGDGYLRVAPRGRRPRYEPGAHQGDDHDGLLEAGRRRSPRRGRGRRAV